MSADSLIVTIAHASMEVYDTRDQALSDMEKLTELDADILCGTESGEPSRQVHLKEILQRAGYRTLMPTVTDGWAAVKKDMVHSEFDVAYTEVLPSSRELGHPHPHGPRGVVQVSFRHKSLGKITVIGGGHYLTLGRTPGQAIQDDPRCHVDHLAWNKRLGLAITHAAVRGAKGKGISFVTADANLVDRENDVFFRAPLTTCWDELKKWPDTGHGNIDIIGSVDNDSRVTCESAKVLDDAKLHLFTDHYPIVAKYRVRKLNP